MAVGYACQSVRTQLARMDAFTFQRPGAVKYTILKGSCEKNVIFDLEKSLRFDGDTSLYIQYNYARIN